MPVAAAAEGTERYGEDIGGDEDEAPGRPVGLPVVGSQAQWMRDWALIVASAPAVATVVATFRAPELVPPLLVAVLLGAASGAMVGLVVPPALERLRGRVPLAVLGLLGFPLSAAWGWVSAMVGVMVLATMTDSGAFLYGSVVFATLAIPTQLGLAWFPYTFASVMQWRTWPVALAASILPWLLVLALFSL